MDKIVCPECGGQLVYESLCQYGIIRKVRPDGLIQLRKKTVDYGSLDEDLLYCPECSWICHNFTSDGISVSMEVGDDD